ncbi:MAG: histidine phosphatase family protein, partial [Desulfuromonadales bacterium]|nr:histidine phosphatase family protein [Desulfuromonadales bacterium]
AEALFDVPVHSDSELPRRQRLEYYLATIERWAAGDAAIEDTPPADDFLTSIDRWLTSLAAESPSGSRVLAVTSAGVIAALMCRVLNLPAKEIANLMGVSDNGSLTTILFSGKRLSLQGFNASGHLARDNLSAI